MGQYIWILAQTASEAGQYMKYKYVIFQPPYDYYDITYHDVKNEANVQFINIYPAFGSLFEKKLCLMHRSSKYNSLIKLPFQSIWNPLFFKSKFCDNSNLCFLFSAGTVYLEKYGFVSYLKRKYPTAKFVCFYQDIISSVRNYSFDDIRKIFDYVISYDLDEANHNGLIFHNTVFSNYPVPPNDSIELSDVYFVGAAKNRYNAIISMFEFLTEQGLKCDFNIIGVPQENQRYTENIHYLSYMSYVENLQHVVKTKVVLEMMQNNAVGASLRVWESIMYEKHLLTNNVGIKRLDVYNPNYMHLIETGKLNIREWVNKDVFYDGDVKDSIKPYRLLEFIDNLF